MSQTLVTTTAYVPSQVNPTVYTSAVAPTVGELNQYNCTSGALAPSLPLAATVARGLVIGFKKTDATTNFLTPTCSGSDHVDSSSGGTSLPIKTNSEIIWFTSDGVSVWTKSVGALSLASLDARFDAIGAAAAAQAASQPLDSDLTAIAALSTTTFGRSLLTQASAAATLTTLGALGTTGNGSALTGLTQSQVSGLTAALALLAPLASPALSGAPTAPTPTALDNSTKLATTAYADGLLDASLPPMTPGYVYAGISYGTPGTVQMGNGQLAFTRLPPGRSCTLVWEGIGITTGGSAGALIRLGVFVMDYLTGNLTLVQDGGTVAATGTGIVHVTLSAAVTKSVPLLLGMAVQGSPVTAPTVSSNNGVDAYIGVPQASAATLSTNPLIGLVANGITGAFPSTIAASSLSAQGSPFQPRVMVGA